jgi:hypothetical protein
MSGTSRAGPFWIPGTHDHVGRAAYAHVPSKSRLAARAAGEGSGSRFQASVSLAMNEEGAIHP